MGLVEVPLWRVGLAYVMLIVPTALILWLRMGLLGRLWFAVIRMTLQLLFVGLYVQVIFQVDKLWLTALWMGVMVLAADVSVVRGSGLKMRRMGAAIFAALCAGALPPLTFFLGAVLALPGIFRAQYAIPLFGMILGNCMTASIVALRTFFQQATSQERQMLYALAQGATLWEALVPFVRNACIAAISPTIERITTLGLVTLPGMMSGVVLTGESPFKAVEYQTVIMLSALCGTSMAVAATFWVTIRSSFTAYGILDRTALEFVGPRRRAGKGRF